MRALEAAGLNQGSSGNASLRVASGLLITPSALPAAALEPEDIVALDLEGRASTPSPRRPSSEWRLHCDLYRARPEVAAVVHVHSPCATAIACTRQGIPAFHYMVAMAGGPDIPCAAYATFGSAELSAETVRTLAGRQACLLANHGAVTVGRDLREALDLAREVEQLARIYLLSRAAGEPVILDGAEMARVLERFADYRHQG
jgi:L-fuculose-phosphate aldolase